MEEDKTYKIRIMFDIDVPKNTIDSDFNSLILRLNKLRDFISTNEVDTISIEENNRNIQEMQNTLEHFRIKEINRYEWRRTKRYK